MSGGLKVPLRTRVYIDGFNFYYGCLRNTPYKWLDLRKLFEKHVLPSILYRPQAAAEPATMELDHCAIRYFTAPILGRAAKASDSVASQNQYHAALSSFAEISITKGYYSLTKSSQYLVDGDSPDKDPNECAKVTVWKLEEKQSDVNLALSLYDDALSCPALDQLVVVTNDTDIAPALALIKQKKPHLVIGLVIPTKPDEKKDASAIEREPNADLRKYADWTRTHIKPQELAASQLPRVVKGRRKDAIKPISWYARSDLLQAAMAAALPIKPKPGDFFQWAEKANDYMDKQRPIDLLESDAGAAVVMAYITGYIRDQLRLEGFSRDTCKNAPQNRNSLSNTIN
ncbi:NYN domain-containing protein [Xanthomonas euvesicatoria]|uniref:NYN domain-containing protein n=1 Tax=Xanthomonas euvesicatoria TaxID=456327 RepID=UPI002404AD74|nr:NYN domain-containing protein [Xanthomonas euvesicatoria]